MRAWHFVREDRRLGYGDGRAVVPGETMVHRGPVELCHQGLHASRRPIDALRYAPGSVVCRVECGGEVIEDHDKLVCTERTVVWVADATETLRRFARLCALDVVHLWDPPVVVVRYLRTGDPALRDAAMDAAMDAARAAARNAAWDAARNAAMDAAMDAARAAARNAAWDAAWDAARDAQNLRLARMLAELGRREGERG